MNNVKLRYSFCSSSQKKGQFCFQSLDLVGGLTTAFSPFFFTTFFPKPTVQYSYEEDNLTFEHYQIIKI